ncbi:MAG TPA: SWIM zinc finger family protein [Candidatus Xenobia bacterium]
MRTNGTDHHPKTFKRVAEYGIKARNAQGGFAEQWWAQRWIGTLESFGWSNRLARGKSYALSGQVIDYHVHPGEIVAKVQGSRPKPYTVKISMHTLTNSEWDRAIHRMAGSASYAARLLSGEMPQDIEDVFTDLGSSLLPTHEWDLKTNCSCPDYANPCKHIAAVHYILGEAFDQDPFLIFQLRGRSREQLLAALRSARGGTPERKARKEEDHGPLFEPLPHHPADFWRASRLSESFDPGFEAPHVAHSILTRLGSPGPWVQAADFVEKMAPALSCVSHNALHKEKDEKDKAEEKPARKVIRKLAEPVTVLSAKAEAVPIPVAAPEPVPVAMPAPPPPPPAPEPIPPAPPVQIPVAPAEVEVVDVPAEVIAEDKPSTSSAISKTRRKAAARSPLPTAPTLVAVAATRRPTDLNERELTALELGKSALVTTEIYRKATGLSAYEAREELFSLQMRGYLQREGQGRWTSWSLTQQGRDVLSPH